MPRVDPGQDLGANCDFAEAPPPGIVTPPIKMTALELQPSPPREPNLADPAQRDLLAGLPDLVREAEHLLEAVQHSAGDSPPARLAQARRALDRVEGIRERSFTIGRRLRMVAFDADQAEALALANATERAGSLVAQGLAADERRARYMLRNRLVVQSAMHARFLTQEHQHFEWRLRDIRDSINGHRMEALALLRDERSLNLAEYDTLTRRPPEG